MQDNRSIGKDWAKKTLEHGYARDFKHSTTTEYKHWNKETKKWELKTIELSERKRTILNFKTRFIK